MLTGTERAMLDLEAQTFRFAGSKEQAIIERFGMSSTRYYQRLNALLARPEAWEYAPTTVARLRRLRDSRSKVRSVRRGA